ncbi:MAG TPA: FecR domain-containing protein [Stellaceae bacterium]|nr:FecR domain-containing protein [Stellaceae bacterium]
MRSALFVVACFLVLLLTLGPVNADDAEIGMVKTVKGPVAVMRDGQRSDARVGSILHQDDVIETGAAAAVGVTFVDNTTLSLGPKTRIALTVYLYHPRENKYAFVMEMTRGTLMYVSGLIEKNQPDAVTINTTVGTVGVRGTRLLIETGQ